MSLLDVNLNSDYPVCLVLMLNVNLACGLLQFVCGAQPHGPTWCVTRDTTTQCGMSDLGKLHDRCAPSRFLCVGVRLVSCHSAVRLLS